MHQAPGEDDSDENYYEFSNQEEMKHQQQDVPQSFNTIKTTDMVHPSNIIDQRMQFRNQQDEEVIPLDQPSVMVDEQQPLIMIQEQKRPMIFNSKGSGMQTGFDIDDANK